MDHTVWCESTTPLRQSSRNHQRQRRHVTTIHHHATLTTLQHNTTTTWHDTPTPFQRWLSSPDIEMDGTMVGLSASLAWLNSRQPTNWTFQCKVPVLINSAISSCLERVTQATGKRQPWRSSTVHRHVRPLQFCEKQKQKLMVESLPVKLVCQIIIFLT